MKNRFSDKVTPCNGEPFAVAAHTLIEWVFEATQHCGDPFNEIEIDMEIQNASGGKWKVAAFWSGEQKWRVRFAASSAGAYSFETYCSSEEDQGLHGLKGEFEVSEYQGANQLFTHGPLRVSDNKRYLQHEDGTPFFWLGDTQWMSLTQRLKWPEEFCRLISDRVEKGFSVIQIVAGLYPDMDWGDERGMNEAGLPYSLDFTHVNPSYYDLADQRIEYLIQSGLFPGIVGSWGYFLQWMGIQKMKKHWRYLIARWGAYPVVWCLAGEAKMPYYLSTTQEVDAIEQMKGWTEIARYVRETDPMGRLVTIHPTSHPTAKGRDQIEDDSLLDFEMLQTGHEGHDSIPDAISVLKTELERTPPMPVLNAEANYEGILGGNYDDVQRVCFWACFLSGACGHTYGANGIWQVNGSEKPYGPSPHGNTWGNRPWEEAMHLPGSTQMGLGKAILERYPWWRFEPRQDWVSPASNAEDYFLPYAAGIPGQVRFIYMCRSQWGQQTSVLGIENDTPYQAKYINPSTGHEIPLGAVLPDEDGSWLAPIQPELRDWLLILEANI